MAAKGYIFDIKRYAVHDGPGIRTTVFFKGCPLKCRWCHNPEGISTHDELMHFEYKCMHCKTCEAVCEFNAVSSDDGIKQIDRALCSRCGICAQTCPTSAMTIVGRYVTSKEIIDEVERDILFYDNSGGGVTFSGGEPLLQHSFLLELLHECKDRGLHTVLDTSGFSTGHILSSVMDLVDVFLYDIKLSDDDQHKKYTGVTNIVIKDNLRMLTEAGRGKDIILRLPVIPDITDTEENIDGTIEFISTLKGINEIDLLPYHDVSEKYRRLGMEYMMHTHETPPKERLLNIKERFEKLGLYVKL